MLFINISSDFIRLSDGKKEQILDRENIENHLGPVLVKRYKENGFDEVLVLNGPGSFTHLRIGTLAVNLLNSLENNKIKIYEISKPDLFQDLFDRGFFGKEVKKMLMYIGQKKNVREYDFKTQKYKTIAFKDIEKSEIINYVLDEVKKEYRSENLSVENLDIISLKSDGKGIKTSHKNNEISLSLKDLKLEEKLGIQANYFIEANVN